LGTSFRYTFLNKPVIEYFLSEIICSPRPTPRHTQVSDLLICSGP
jgi:hypothetical protein